MTNPISSPAKRFFSAAMLVGAVVGTAGPGAAQEAASADQREVRVTTSTDRFDRTLTIDETLESLLAAPLAEPDSGTATGAVGHLHRRARGEEVPVVDVELDGHSEMVVIQPRDANGNGVEHTQLAIRSREDGQWSGWELLHSDGQEGPDGLPGEEGSDAAAEAGTGAIGPIWVGEGATGVEVALIAGEVQSLVTEALDAPEAPVVANSNPDQRFASQLLASAPGWANRPAIRPNSEWGSPGFRTGKEVCEDGPRYTDSLQAMVVHHTVTTNDYTQAEVPKLLLGIHRFHTVNRGWCDVAYNFLVDRFGTLWEGRSGGIDKPVIGGHARGFNSNTFAVALLGQHQSNIRTPAGVRPSPASLQAIKDLGAWKLRLHGVDPNGRTLLKNTATDGVLKHPPAQYVSVPTILGHRDLGETSCPGNFTMPIVDQMKTEFNVRAINAPVPYASTGVNGNDFGPKLMAVDNRGGLRPALGQATPTAAPGSGSAATIAVGGTATDGYVLRANGTLEPYGGAPAVPGTPGGTAPVDLIVRDSGKSGYVVTPDGTLHGFGGKVVTRRSNGPAVAGDVNDDKVGYTVSAAGVLNPVFQSPPRTLGSKPAGSVIDIVVFAAGNSGYVLTDIGEVIGFGSAGSFGDVLPTTPVAVVAGPNANGGWVLDSEGRFWNFGDERPVANAKSHVGTGMAADAVLTGHDLDPGTFAESDDYKYLSGVLARLDPSRSGNKWIDHWNWQTDFKSTKVLGDAMVRRPEFTNVFVDDTYRRSLGREPDAVGRKYWTDLLDGNGITLRNMGIYFYGSEELFNKSGRSGGAYVDRLYDALLHRAPDVEGRAYWANLIDSGQASPADVTAGFYDSIESRRDRVDYLYNRIAGTTPGAAQRERWAADLETSDDLTLASTMVASPTLYRYLTR